MADSERERDADGMGMPDRIRGFALADLGRDTRLIQDYLGHRNIRHTVIYTATNTQRFMNVWGNMKENHTISARM